MRLKISPAKRRRWVNSLRPSDAYKNQYTKLVIQENASENIVCEMTAILCRGISDNNVTPQNIGHLVHVSMYWNCERCWTLHWRHNDHDSVSNHQPHGCLLNRVFKRRSKETSRLRVTGLCVGNSPGTGEFPAQRTSNAENFSIWWRHHELIRSYAWSHCHDFLF